MENLLLYQKIISLPENLKSEVEEFIDSLYNKIENKGIQATPIFGSAKEYFIIKPGISESEE